jgi:hypothetical protein
MQATRRRSGVYSGCRIGHLFPSASGACGANTVFYAEETKRVNTAQQAWMTAFETGSSLTRNAYTLIHPPLAFQSNGQPLKALGWNGQFYPAGH